MYFRREHFKTSVPIAMTAMLVMYTLNSSIASKLPKTSSIKFIDIWIFFGLFLMFLILLLHVLIEHLPSRNDFVSAIDTSKENDKQLLEEHKLLFSQELVKYFSQRILPLLEVLVIISYLVCAWVLQNLTQ